MPHFICRWPGGDVLLASVDSRQELDAILQERCEPGVCKVARYHGPLVMELSPQVPGMSRASAERFKPAPACPAFMPVWRSRSSTGDVDILAGDGSCQRVHKLVLQCRLPALQGQPLAAGTQQVRLRSVPDSNCLDSLVQFLYLDNVEQQGQLTPELHGVALACGLQRLVQLCEASFAQQLEHQLLNYPSLVAEQREEVLDSFVGWTRYCDQNGRQDLRQLCVHALAQYATAAQSRPCWSTLQPQTASLVQLIAASTAPPLVHRQLVADGTFILPAASKPALGAAAAVVCVDAEAFASAGGKMTSPEWQQLQNFRAAVAESQQVPEASPLVLNIQQLASSSLVAPEGPQLSFTVKQPLLSPHKRLMDSMCRFAFPSTQSLLTGGWQLPMEQNAAAETQRAAEANDGADLLAREEQQQLVLGPAARVPVLVPIVQPVSAAASAENSPQKQQLSHEEAAALSSRDDEAIERSCSSSQHRVAATAVNALLQQQHSSRASGTGGSSPVTAAEAEPSSLAARQLQSRLLASCTGSPAISTSRSHSNISSRLELRPVISGSGLSSPGSDIHQALQHAAEQQQIGVNGAGNAQHAALPLHLQHLLVEHKQSGSWGSGAGSRHSSNTLCQATGAYTQPQQQQQQGRHLSIVRCLSQTDVESRVAFEQQQLLQQQQQEQHRQDSEVPAQVGAETANEHGLGLAAAASAGEQQQQQQLSVALRKIDEQVKREKVLPGYSTECMLDLPAMNVTAGVSALLRSSDVSAGAALNDLPAATAVGQFTSNSGSNPIAALQRALLEDFALYEEASAARQHVVGILVAIEQGDTAAGQRLLAPSCAELIAATAPVSAANRAIAEGAGPASGISRLHGMASISRAALEPTPAQLQRRHQQLLEALQRIGAQLPALSGLLTSSHLPPMVQNMALAAAAAATSLGLHQTPAGTIPLSHTGSVGTHSQLQSGGIQSAIVSADLNRTGAASSSQQLDAAITDLVHLPELLQGLQVPMLLSHEQFQQRQHQLQHLAQQAANVLANNMADAAGTEAGKPLTAAAATARQPVTRQAATPPVATSARAADRHEGHTSELFNSIRASLGAGPVAGPSSTGPYVAAGLSQAGAGGAAAAGFMQDSMAATMSASTCLSAMVAAHANAFGILAANGRATATAQAGAMMAAMGAAAAAAAAVGSPGALTPTGANALLAGGLLAEGGVAGDSVFEDMAADMLLQGTESRRITCHGLYELCAALATPTGTQEAAQQQQEHCSDQAGQSSDAAGCLAPHACVRPARAGDIGDLAVPPGASAAAACLPSLSGRKRRLSVLSDTGEEQQPECKR